MLTKPTDIDYELYILKYYIEVCSRLSAYLEYGKSVYAPTDPGEIIDTNRTTLEEDMELLRISSETYNEKDDQIKERITSEMR